MAIEKKSLASSSSPNKGTEVKVSAAKLETSKLSPSFIRTAKPLPGVSTAKGLSSNCIHH